MAWSAAQYLKFEDERTRPARDLLAQVPLSQVATAIDLGCGPGNSTELIAKRYPHAQLSGMDSDANMLESAVKRLPAVKFFMGDLSVWQPETPVDLMFSNAVFQWLPNHIPLLQRLMGGLTPGGVLAIQMPDNLSEPSHTLMAKVAHEGLWAERFEGGAGLRAQLPAPQDYVNALSPLSDRVVIWHTTYYHQLENAAAIVEWVKGTGLRPWLDALEDRDRPAYLETYLRHITQAYPALDDGRVLLKFPRFFLVAVKKR
jgi:trans-aconitate 2-methyltransferase